MSLYERLYGISSVCLDSETSMAQTGSPWRGRRHRNFCGLLHDGGRPTVYGDGRQTRDYIFVADVVAAMLAAAVQPRRARSTSARDRDRCPCPRPDLAELAETRFDPEFRPTRTGEVQRITIDPGRAEAELGWCAQTSLSKGLRVTLRSI